VLKNCLTGVNNCLLQSFVYDGTIAKYRCYADPKVHNRIIDTCGTHFPSFSTYRHIFSVRIACQVRQAYRRAVYRTYRKIYL